MENDKEKEVEDNDENLSNSVALLAKRFGKVIRRLDKRSRNNSMTNVKCKVPYNSRGLKYQRRIKEGDNLNKGSGIQCYDCEGFRHIQA